MEDFLDYVSRLPEKTDFFDFIDQFPLFKYTYANMFTLLDSEPPQPINHTKKKQQKLPIKE